MVTASVGHSWWSVSSHRGVVGVLVIALIVVGIVLVNLLRLEKADRSGWVRSIWVFTWGALHPTWSKRLRWMWTTLSVAAMFVPAVLAATLGVVPWAVAVLSGFAILAVLLLVEGARLQKDSDDRHRPQFGCSGRIERVGDAVVVGTEVYTQNAFVWVRVQNFGPAATFSARLVKFVAAPIIDPFYEIAEAAWDRSLDGALHLPRGGFANLKIATFSFASQTLWFYGARSATWATDSHQASRRFQNFTGECRFDLELHNEVADVTEIYKGLISVNNEQDQWLSFRLDQGSHNFALYSMSAERPVMGGSPDSSSVEQ